MAVVSDGDTSKKILIAVEESEPLTEDTPLPTHLILRQSTRAADG